MLKQQAQVNRDLLTTHSADCYKWHHECAIAEVERLREKVKSWAELEQQYQAGCTHCTHPMYCGIRKADPRLAAAVAHRYMHWPSTMRDAMLLAIAQAERAIERHHFKETLDAQQ